jgi:lysophospholipase L1-like esterase
MYLQVDCFTSIRGDVCDLDAGAQMTSFMKARFSCLMILLLAWFAWFAPILAAQSSSTSGAFALREGDRVLFYGDSITAQRFYTRDVEEFVLTRYPNLKVEFLCAGVSGDTVYGGYTGDATQRLARDVVPFKATVITVMLGMNDPGYVPFDPHIFDVFRSGYESLIGKLTSAFPEARLTLIASSPYDELTHGTDFPGLGGTVQKYGMFVKQLADERHLVFANYNSALDEALRAAMKENLNYAALLIPDRIHPSEQGHWVMGESLMRAWHASPEVSRMELDAAKRSVVVARNVEVSELVVTEKRISWTALEHSLPLPFSLDDPLMKFTIKVANLEDMDQEILQVHGLVGDQYSLQIDGKPVLDLTREQLNAGVNLAVEPTPMLDQANGLSWLEDRKMKMDAARFALEAEMPATPGAADAVSGLRAAETAVTVEQRQKAKPASHKFLLLSK